MQEFPTMTSDAPPSRPSEAPEVNRNAFLNELVDRTTMVFETMPLTWEEKVSALILVAVKVLAKEAPIKGRRGAVIKAVTNDFHRKLQSFLPF